MLTPLFAIFFGSPLTVLLTAAGAASIPLIIHLLNRKRYRIVSWAAMRFLLAAQKKNTRRLRIEHLLLLLIRILIVLLILLAMAAVTKWAEDIWARSLPNGTILTTPGGRRVHRIVVLDGSMSMGLKVGETTCFERARQLAIRLVKESQRGDGFSVILMASSPRPITGSSVGPSEDSARVIAELESLRLPHGNSDLAGTLHSVLDLLRKSPGKFVEKEVYFVSDMQKTSWVLPRPADIAEAVKGISDKARTILLDVGVADPPPNLAVVRLGLYGDRPVALTGQKSIVMATIRNYGEETPDKVRITLQTGRAADKPGDKPFAFSEGRTVTRMERIARGDYNVALECTFDAPGDWAVQVRVEGDALDLDDSRSMVLRVRDSIPVILVNGKPAADPYDQATEYLYDALNPFQDQQLHADAPVRPKKLSATEFADAGIGDLSEADCVFLCDVPRFTVAEARRLETHVLRGGGLVFFLGPNVDLASYNDVLYRNGQGLLPARLLGRQRAPKGHHFRFAADDREWKLAPLAVFDQQETHRHNLLESSFQEFIRTESPSASAGHAPRRILSFLTALDRSDSGKTVEATAFQREAALLEWQPALPRDKDGEEKASKEARRLRQPVPSSRGRVALYTTTANTDWSDWPRKGSFIWLQQELLAYVASPRLRGQWAIVGDTLEQYLPGSTGADEKEVTLMTPDNREEKVRTISRDETALWRWSDTDVSGIYRAVIGSHPREYLNAVNVPVAELMTQGGESDLTRTTDEALHQLYPEWDLQIVKDPGEATRDGKKLLSDAGEPQEPQLGSAIARWLLLLAFVLLVGESLLAWYFGHYSAIHERDRAPGGWLTGSAAFWFKTGVAASLVLLSIFVLVTAGVLIHAAITGDFLGFLPASFRRGVEVMMRVPEPAPGEGSRWSLEYRPYLWSESTDLWLVPLIAVAVGAMVVLLYRREGRVMGPATPMTQVARLIVLCGLRIGMVLLMLGVLMPQLRMFFERQSWPDIVILIDDSASMSEVDRYHDGKVKEVADRLAELAELSKPQRLQLAQALLTRGDQDWITRLLTERQVKVHVYHCSSRAARLETATQFGEVEKTIEAIRDLEANPRHDSSQLGAAVRQVLNDFRGSSLAALIMLTDGNTTEGEDLVQVAKYATQLKEPVPLFFVGIGDANESRDIIVSDLEVARTIFVNDNLIFRFNVSVKGYGDQVNSVKVRLHEKGSDKDLASQVVTADPTGKPVKVRLEHRPTTPGDRVYVVETDIKPDEVNKKNNQQTREVWVTETKTIKILYIEGYARWEFRALKTLLERESDRIKNNKTMELKFWLQDSDPQFRLQDENALGDLPTKAELSGYDVVLLGDVNPLPPDNPNKMVQFLKDLAEFVREKGGGLLMMAGERYAPHAYKDSPLRDVLPIDIQVDRSPEEPDGGRTESYQPELTAVGRLHPVFSFNEKDNEAAWHKLREMYWHAEGYQPKRAAEVLAVHPTKKMAGATGKESRLPLVMQHFVGEGRAMFYGFGETWRWRFREDEGRFNQFWIQTVRYLARTQSNRVELRLDRQGEYLRGEPIKVTVRFPDEQKKRALDSDVRVIVLNKDIPEQRTMTLSHVEGSRGSFEGVLTQTPVGRYEFWLAKPSVKPLPRAETEVIAPPGEMQKLQMNQVEMETAARETHGGFYTLADAEKLLEDLPTGSRVTRHAPGDPWTLWNHAGMLLIALLFLGVEWILRKRYHLL